MVETKWKTYEQVAQYLLDQFRDRFGLERVEGEQRLPGGRSGTKWKIEAKGICHGSTGFLIVECRRHTTSSLKQEHVGGLAYRIMVTGADGGIIVSPLSLQKGAKKPAAAENIKHVILHQDSSAEEYVMKFLNEIFAGMHDTLTVSDRFTAAVFDKDGNAFTRSAEHAATGWRLPERQSSLPNSVEDTRIISDHSFSG